MPITSGYVFFDSKDSTTRHIFQAKILLDPGHVIELKEGHRSKARDFGSIGELHELFKPFLFNHPVPVWMLRLPKQLKDFFTGC